MTRRKRINIKNQIKTSIIGFENNFAEENQYHSFCTPKMFLDEQDPYYEIKSGFTFKIEKNISDISWCDINNNSQPDIIGHYSFIATNILNSSEIDSLVEKYIKLPHNDGRVDELKELFLRDCHIIILEN